MTTSVTESGKASFHPLISVVVCTYNRARLLAGALRTLCHQTLDKSKYEVIVVDNNSADGTQELVGEYCKHFSHVRYCFEPQPGLSYARNRGWQEAMGEYVAYIDDDARAGENWLKTALALLENTKPAPLCLGGPILPFYNSTKPIWFKEEIRTWGDSSRYLRQGESFSGSNMIWRKEVVETLGGFDVRSGVRGDYLSIGEETVLFEKIWHSFYKPHFYYSPELAVQHWVPPAKMTVTYQLKRAFAAGQSWDRLHGPRILRRRMRFLVGGLLDIATMVGQLLRRRKEHLYVQNWLIEEGSPIFVKLGTLSGVMGLDIRLRQRQ
jgi:glycosyltransferase involved in cell wall biosynthesis